MFRLYREPGSGEITIIGADPADGGSDYCSAVAKSKKHLDSFLVFQARMESSQFGYELHKMSMYVQKRTNEWPVLVVERNVGMATIHVLQTLNYPRLFRMPTLSNLTVEESDKIGWTTTGGVGGTRQMMLDDLALALRQSVTKIPDAETVRELMAFVRDSSGKPHAAAGMHDDLVMAEALALQGMKHAPAASKESMEAKIAQFPKQELFDRHGVPLGV